MIYLSILASTSTAPNCTGSYTLSTSDYARPSQYRVTDLGDYPQRFLFDIDGGIPVSLMDDATTNTRPFAIRQGELAIHVATVGAGLATGKEATNLDDCAAQGFGFVLDLSDELTQANIGDSQGQTPILDHAFDVQVFHADESVG